MTPRATDRSIKSKLSFYLYQTNSLNLLHDWFSSAFTSPFLIWHPTWKRFREYKKWNKENRVFPRPRLFFSSLPENSRIHLEFWQSVSVVQSEWENLISELIKLLVWLVFRCTEYVESKINKRERERESSTKNTEGRVSRLVKISSYEKTPEQRQKKGCSRQM